MLSWIEKLSFVQSIGCLLVIIVTSKLALWHSPFLPLRWILVGFFLMLKYYLAWPDTLKRLQSDRDGSMLTKIVQIMPPSFPALLSMHKAILSSFYKWIKHEPLQEPRLKGERIYFSKKTQYGTALIIFFLACAVDIPFSALMVGLIGHDHTQNVRIHIAILAVTIYAIICVLGDRWSIKDGYHILGIEFLYLRLGERFSADIALSDVLTVEKIEEPVRLWCARNKKTFVDKLLITPIDTPNVLLRLKPHAEIIGKSYKASRKIPGYIFLYVDNPRDFLSKLTL